MQADFLMGASLLKREDESLYEYWLSFSPMAPFFGVPWRFAPAASFEVETPAPKPAETRTPAKAKAKAATPALELVAEVPAAAEDTPAMAPDPAAVMETEAEPAEGEEGAPPAALFDAPPAEPDDLKAIKGVGPKLEAELNALGLYTYRQIASLTPENLIWIDDRLTSFKGRSVRDDWVGQAEALIEG